MFVPININVLHGPLKLSGVKLKGKEFPEGPHNVNIIGISSYPNEQITFIVQGESGWIYTYIPAHYLTFGNVWYEQRNKYLCPSIEFVITKPIITEVNTIDGPAKCLFCVDWLHNNELLWILSLYNGGIVIYPHRKFAGNHPKMLKMRETWK